MCFSTLPSVETSNSTVAVTVSAVQFRHLVNSHLNSDPNVKNVFSLCRASDKYDILPSVKVIFFSGLIFISHTVAMPLTAFICEQYFGFQTTRSELRLL